MLQAIDDYTEEQWQSASMQLKWLPTDQYLKVMRCRAEDMINLNFDLEIEIESIHAVSLFKKPEPPSKPKNYLE